MKLSIIIPLYNSVNYITECLDSLYRQGISQDDFEVIIIDDGSTDGSADIVDSYAKTYSNIVVSHQKNIGSGPARNVGMDIAHGDYIHFVDHDDYLLDNSYRYIFDNLLKYDTDIISLDYYEIEPDDRNVLIGENIYLGDLRPYIQKNKEKVYVWLKLFKRSFFEENNIRWPNITYAEDAIFLYSYLHCKGTILVNSTKFYYYRPSANSIMRTRELKRLKQNNLDFIYVNKRMSELAACYQDCPPIIKEFTVVYKQLYNRILCTPYSLGETIRMFRICSMIAITHLNKNQIADAYKDYLHPVKFFFLRLVRLNTYLHSIERNPNRDGGLINKAECKMLMEETPIISVIQKLSRLAWKLQYKVRTLVAYH